MWTFITAAENLPFSVALAVMIAIALLEGVGMLLGAGLSGFIDAMLPDIDLDAEVPDVQSPGAVSQLLGWLYVGKIPFLVLLIVLLTCFGICGLIVQSVAQALLGTLLPALLASVPALMVALPVSRVSAAALARVIPRDETEAVSASSFVGRVAVITTGTARQGSAAQARLTDQYGQSHYVMVEPDAAAVQFVTGTEVLIIKKKGNQFMAIANPNPNLVEP